MIRTSTVPKVCLSVLALALHGCDARETDEASADAGERGGHTFGSSASNPFTLGSAGGGFTFGSSAGGVSTASGNAQAATTAPSSAASGASGSSSSGSSSSASVVRDADSPGFDVASAPRTGAAVGADGEPVSFTASPLMGFWEELEPTTTSYATLRIAQGTDFVDVVMYHDQSRRDGELARNCFERGGGNTHAFVAEGVLRNTAQLDSERYYYEYTVSEGVLVRTDYGEDGEPTGDALHRRIFEGVAAMDLPVCRDEPEDEDDEGAEGT